MEGCNRLAAALSARESKLHVLINNSGTSWGEPFETHGSKGWDKVMELNLKTPFFLTRALLPLLDRAASPADPSRVIMIGSIAGLRPQPFPTFAYDCSKAALHHLSRKLADELADRTAKGGSLVTVNVIAPGYVPSKMSAQLAEYSSAEDTAARTPLKRMGNAADMAGAALFLSSAAGSWITGAVIPVDGGVTAKL